MSVRKSVQLVFLLFFLFLFVLAFYPLPEGIPPVDLLFRLDPVAAVVSFVASRSMVSRLLLAALLLGLTLLVGRAFCGWICPMGTAIDFWRRLVLRPKEEKRQGPDWRRVKYYLLFAILAGSLLGFSLIWPLNPFGLLTRFLTLTLYPFLLMLANLSLGLLAILGERLDWLFLSQFALPQLAYGAALTALVLFLGILSLDLLQPRFWCRNLCPLGAALGIVSRAGLFSRRVSGCIDCGKCPDACPAGAIPDEPRDTVRSECIQCLACADICPADAISFNLTRPSIGPGLDLTRRRLILSVGAGIVTASLGRLEIIRRDKSSNRIRPPGAVPETSFLARCLRCGECMKVCPTNGLQPATFELGWAGVWSPVLVPRVGGCERYCNECGLVCPSQAIRALGLEEKSYVRIGTAAINKERCIAWEQQKLCLVCDEACPFGAIHFKEVADALGTSRRPFLNNEVCTGCGICEERCPVGGESAIRVTPTGEERLIRGSYITSQKVLARTLALEEKELEETGLPPGFIQE